MPPTSYAVSIASTESARQSKSISGRAEQELIGRRFEFGGVAEQFLVAITLPPCFEQSVSAFPLFPSSFRCNRDLHKAVNFPARALPGIPVPLDNRALPLA